MISSMFVLVWLLFHSVIPGFFGNQEEIAMTDIMDEITTLKTRQSLCDAKVSNLEDVVNKLLRRNDKLEQEIQDIRSVMNPSKENLNVSEDFEPNVTNDKNRHRRMTSSGAVAFTVGVSRSDLTHLGDYHTIIFDKAVTNIGNAYSTKSGIFVAPLKGVYVFTLTLMVLPYHSEYLEIVVDGTLINDMTADSSSVDDYISTTKQWVLDLNTGSEVWIRTPLGNTGQVHGNMHTSFSGFLLFETE